LMPRQAGGQRAPSRDKEQGEASGSQHHQA
jgi:hypothetical protein